MLRLTLALTLMLTFAGLPLALEPFLFQSEPRLVMLNVEEERPVINAQSRSSSQPEVEADAQIKPLSVLEGPQLTAYRPFAEELMAADS